MIVIDIDLYGPIQSDELERPYYAEHFFIMDKYCRMCNTYLMNPVNDRYQIFISLFCEYIERHGVPGYVAIRKPELIEFFKEIFKDSPNVLIGSCGWEVVDEALDEFWKGIHQYHEQTIHNQGLN